MIRNHARSESLTRNAPELGVVDGLLTLCRYGGRSGPERPMLNQVMKLVQALRRDPQAVPPLATAHFQEFCDLLAAERRWHASHPRP